MINYIHKKCNGIAFIYEHKAESSETMQSKFVSFPDGTKPSNGHLICCFSCKESIKPSDVEVEK